jgi:hypothetical protein
LVCACGTLSNKPFIIRRPVVNGFLNDIKDFHKGMVGLRTSTEEKLVRDIDENMFYFTRKTPEFSMDCMTTRHVALFLCP